MMSNVSIEKLDAILERVPNVSYSKAKEALEVCNGDVIEAIIYLEQQGINFKTQQAKKAVEDKLSIDTEEIKSQLKDIIKKSSVIRVIIEKNDKIIMNIPLTAGVVGVALSPILALVGLSTAVIGKYNIKVQNEDDGSIIDLGELSEEKINVLKEMITTTAKDVKVSFNEDKKDHKDITDELIKEDEISEDK